ncbi:M24 family metallopeptidase [Campylobacter suis]|uniref:Aminopeptidase n=1 Tax=Campylobacter suis TaxID=2790657 RepID=A0ABN7K7E7_9BACT|nr:M24 family metallopeptidase [Campylobacter suis]CAD7288392.1 Aminopeptidase [Campylobacter suis]
MTNYILRGENALYFECGYSCDNAIFLSINGKKFFLTDARYALEAKECVYADVSVIELSRSLVAETRLLLRKLKPKSLVYDPYDFSVATFDMLSQKLGLIFKPKANFSQLKRIIKSPEEIKILKQASEFGAACFDEFADFVRQKGEGMSERELHYNAELIFRQKNRLGLSFSPIVAINENAAKVHALPSEKRLKKGDLLLLDAGVRYKNYCSDRTRTACFNESFNFLKEQNFTNSRQQEIYEVVLNAQKAALNAIKPGIMACEVDKAARDVIKKSGYEKEFIHSTGHGVGIDIHELPVINSKSKTILKEGMVFSVEPGIYIPNEFGVRIEDVVVVREKGAEIL